MKNLSLEWVDEPRPDWKDELLDMADGYPFEKKRRSHQNIDPQELCKSTWSTDGSLQEPFLAAYFDKQIVGWIHVKHNELQSNEITRDLYDGTWELVQRNRNDVRNALLDEIENRFPEDVVHLQQPAQNRTARHAIRKRPHAISGGLEMYVARWDSNLPDAPSPDTGVKIRDLNATNDDVRNLIDQYQSSYLHESPLFDQKSASRLHYQWIQSALEKERFTGKTLHRGDELVGIGIYARTGNRSSTKSASLSYIQIDNEHQGEGLGHFLLETILSELKTKNVNYVEIKLNANNKNALRFYRNHGFEPVSKREHFYLLPPGSTLIDENT